MEQLTRALDKVCLLHESKNIRLRQLTVQISQHPPAAGRLRLINTAAAAAASRSGGAWSCDEGRCYGVCDCATLFAGCCG